jgi:hypothetical protein
LSSPNSKPHSDRRLEERMTFEEVLISASGVLHELTRELVRRGDECYRKDRQSQETACLFVAIRAASLARGIGRMLHADLRDSHEVLTRAFLEARDLVLTFRFDDNRARTKIKYWFAGKVGSSWKVDHKKCEEFLNRLAPGSSDLSERWSMFTALSHPTFHAATNSIKTAMLWAPDVPRPMEASDSFTQTAADYLTSLATLILISTIDFPGLVSLGCDLDRMPTIDSFRDHVSEAVLPIMSERANNALPPGSYRA